MDIVVHLKFDKNFIYVSIVLLCCNGGEESTSFEDHFNKKVRFKEGSGEESVDMLWFLNQR